MPTFTTFSGLSGTGDFAFTASGMVNAVRVDVTNLGHSNQVDADSSFPRYFKLGWWTFIDNTGGLGQAATGPIQFVEFQHGRFDVDHASVSAVGGYHGIHYHFYAGVIATFVVEEL